jgi:hypothetical protein
MRMFVRRGLWVLLMATIVSPAAQAAWSWPFKDSAKKSQHSATTLHPAGQHAARPLGNHLRVVKQVGTSRPPPKTILAKRTP